MNKNTNKNYSTANFYLSAFLSAKGLALIGIDRSNTKRARFLFNKSPRGEELSEAFLYAKEGSPDVLIDARKFVNAIKSLKEKLYEGKS